MKIKTLVITLLIPLIMAACKTAIKTEMPIPTSTFAPTEVPGQISELNPTAYLEQVLILNKCKRPCWLGLEPSMVSSIENVEEILVQVYGNESVYTSPKAYPIVHWRIKNSDFPQHGTVVLTEDKQIASTQVFFDEKSITVDNLISVIGEPEYVLLAGDNQPQGFRCDGVWGMLYLQSGLEVLTESTPESIMPSQFVYYIGIAEPSALTDKHWWSNPAVYQAVQWEGYNSYCGKQ